MSKKKSNFHDMAIQQCLGINALDHEKSRWFYMYRNIALNMYRWKNLPNGIESRHIEKALFEHGQVFFYRDNECGLMCLPCSNSGQQNVYGDPLSYIITGYGYSKTKLSKEGVRIINNDSIIPTIVWIDHFSEKMAEVEKTISKNLRQQRNPYLIRTTKDNEFSVKNLYNKIENDEPAIFIDKDLANGDDGAFVKEDIWKDFRGLDYIKLMAEYEKQILTFLGLNSVIQKESGMGADEINSNNGQIEMNLDLGFKCRQRAAELINEQFGLNIEVEKVISNIEKTIVSSLDKGVERDV